MTGRLDQFREPVQRGNRVLRAVRNGISRSREDRAYATWLKAHVGARRSCLNRETLAGRFSLMTAVYARTPARYFRKMAASVLNQTYSQFEWLLLVDGPIPAKLERIITQVAGDVRVRLLREEVNRGIVPGFRRCLETATGEYVIPADGDDVLLPDALHVLSRAIDKHAKPEFVYTDEDHLIRGAPRSPYFRPVWDPVLNLSSSYIWHMTAFRRETAHDLDAYGDERASFCHDWDTVHRFAAAGISPVHIPEIVYHWRRHSRSSTNRRSRHAGSLQSQRAVLERRIEAQEQPSLYELKPFPIFRGAEEWWISRRAVSPPPMDAIIVGDTNGAPPLSQVLRESEYPFAGVHVVDSALGMRAELARVLHDVRSEFVVVLNRDIRPHGNIWPWEAACLFEFHSDVVLLGGRLIENFETVVGDSFRPQSPGPFGIFLKQRSVDVVDPRFFLGRTDFLKRAARGIGTQPLAELGRSLGEAAKADGLRVATSPLIAARPI